jgi:tetratricopeptide (TPR) repeat protein
MLRAISRKAGIVILCVFLQALPCGAELVISPSNQEKKADPAWIHQQASELFQKGIDLINSGNFDEGLGDIRQTTQLEPQVPEWHMQYGNLLFAKAGLLYRTNQQDEAVLMAKEAEKELRSALDLFTGTGSGAQRSQCYFLMGDLAYYIHKDSRAAKELYQKSLEADPSHQAAKEALKTCE